ncbi:ABC-type sugar transport system ATPase subunit [Sinorhizobium terangae]|nr:ABC-type sugar transport system ATPase subunit [Sinorhizobium terangae]
MRAEIKELHQRLKTTTVYVTHDQIEAMTMADKIVVMRNGRVEQIGKPLELFDRPANTFVATFIGSPSMNLFEGEILNGKFVMRGAALPLPAGHDGVVAKTYGIRPEHLSIRAEGVPATVVVVEPTGSETHVLVKLGDEDVTLLLRDRVELRPGQTIPIGPDLTKVHLFGGDGKRVN